MDNKLPPLEDIHVFTVAANAINFAAAAEKLQVSPAYISKRIRLLEQNFGFALFLRSSRHLKLTTEGEMALQQCEQILEIVQGIQSQVNEYKHEPKGRIRLVTSTGFGQALVAPALSSLIAEYPGLALDLELLDRPIDLLSEGFDLEIKVGGTLPPALIAKKLAENKRVFCASPAYVEKYGLPVRLDDLKAHHLIAIRERDRPSGSWQLQDAKGKAINMMPPPPRLATNKGEVALQWCFDDHGIMLRSWWNVCQAIKEKSLVHILPDYAQTADIYAIYTQRVESSAALRVTLAVIQESLSNCLSDNH